MKTENQNQKLAWRLHELAAATGLSRPYLRLKIRQGKLSARKLGGAVIVLDSDARAFLAGELPQAERGSQAAAQN